MSLRKYLKMRNGYRPVVALKSGRFICNVAAAEKINSLEKKVFKLEKEIVRLASILNCNADKKGHVVFKRITPCCCVQAEVMQRDALLENLEKENGILRKQLLLKKKD